jgi:UDP-N-acetylmuramate--L-alanine ligase
MIPKCTELSISKMLEKHQKIHFIGIAGLLVSSLACIAKALGFEVTGSDETAYPPATTTLAQHQINWINGHRAENLDTPDLVVLGTHIQFNNPELQAAIARQLKIVSSPEFLRMLFTNKMHRVIPAGAHGKSTITSMIGWILIEADLDPTILIGAISHNLESSFRKGEGTFLVLEGDEYKSSCLDSTPKFLYYQPTDAILTSVELDHFDLYHTVEKQFETYKQFCQSVAPEGLILLCADSPAVRLLADSNITANVQTYGFCGRSDWQATDIRFEGEKTHFSIVYDETRLGEFSIWLPGKHNVQNALAATAMATRLGVPIEIIRSSLYSFLGVGRRFEIKGDINGVIVVDDFAHHPSAIKSTLEATRMRYPSKRIWCIYEPHTYSRIKGSLEKFEDAFEGADEVVISDIYPARERDLKGLIHSREIIEIARKQTPNIHYIPTAKQVLSYLIDNVLSNDLVMFMSVGRFEETADKLVQYLREST